MNWPLSRTLIRFPGVHAPWTIGNAVEHTQIFGSPGSGKTSGSGYHIASAFLSNGFGGLVLAAKTSEIGLWKSLAEEHGRSDDLVIVDASGDVPFNFMDYELKRGGEGAGDPGGIVDLFMELNRLRESNNAAPSGGENEQFFKDNTGRLIRAAVTVASLSDHQASLSIIEDLIASSPTSQEQIRNPDWWASSLLAQSLLKIREVRYADLPPDQQVGAERAEKYWLESWPNLPERTRESIRATYQGISDQFLEGRYRRLFCSETRIVPEVTHHGTIIVLDLPPSEHGVFGRIAQVLFKHIWQQATLRRITKTGKSDTKMRPVFLWADESQNFITSLDSQFLNEAREAKAAVVYLTQGLPNYDAVLGRDRTRSMLNSLGTKVFHALGDADTIEYASRLAGQQTIFRESVRSNAQRTQTGRMSGPEIGYQESEESVLSTHDFYGLAKGDNREKIVEAFLIMAGKRWPPDDQPVYRWQLYRRGS